MAETMKWLVTLEHIETRDQWDECLFRCRTLRSRYEYDLSFQKVPWSELWCFIVEPEFEIISENGWAAHSVEDANRFFILICRLSAEGRQDTIIYQHDSAVVALDVNI